MSIYRRLLRASRPYLVAEVVGTLCAISGAWIAHHLTASNLAAGWVGSICEGVGFYGVIFVVESRYVGRSTEGRLRSRLRIIPGLLVKFGPAEIVDSVVVRPLMMGAGPQLTGSIFTGTVLGKLVADAAFYLTVAASVQLRRRFTQRRATPNTRSERSAAALPAATSVRPGR